MCRWYALVYNFYEINLTINIVFKGVLFLFYITVHITNTQESNALVVKKPINSTITVTCPGCENNNGSCLITINEDVITDKNNYTLLDNGSLILLPNDITIYGSITCSGSAEHLTHYYICPPYNGKYYNITQNFGR